MALQTGGRSLAEIVNETLWWEQDRLSKADPNEEEVAAGRIVDGHQLQPAATATTVRLDREGRPTITDGPFIEGKEMVGGYAILDVADLDAALAVASSWPAPDVLEVRPIMERG